MNAHLSSEFNDREPPRDNAAFDDTLTHCSADAVVRILDEYLAALDAGTAPSRDELLARYPAAAAQLEACLAGLDFIHGQTSAPRMQQQLGDFRIVREVGRGGMGAVYEAEQRSLGRRVALKVLRFGTVADREAIERFQREAETVAALHHTNIVPIFFVGNEQGVNYYAMQFIEGRNLAEVLAEQDTPLAPSQVAGWALQAAEALAHAHHRGVIHRDVKPSNLILDCEGRLWLTDFGLARRTADVTLSLTGMLLGTPRYMSPEQASAAAGRVDQRSDLFSLGATLYELLTGVPAFSGAAPHDVIQQILVGDPTLIRKHNPAVPRDLETIVMKCLAKEPQARFQSADDLAADLRAQIEGRPIRARRTSPFELAVRWLKQHQRSVSQIAAAVTLTLALTVTAIMAWNGYAMWNQASVLLDAVDPPLVAEFWNHRGELVDTETLPMQNAATLPAGEYKVRVSGSGMLSQTMDLTLDRGRRDVAYTANLTDHWLFPPQKIESSFDVVDLGEQRGVVLWRAKGLALRNRWSIELSPETCADLKEVPGFSGPGVDYGSLAFAGRRPSDLQPWLVQQPIDVDDDGVGDIVFAARHQAWVMAVSGVGNKVLWFAGRGDELAQPVSREQTYGGVRLRSAILHRPLVVSDLDGDGSRDLVISAVDLGNSPRAQQNRYDGRRWIEALSSRTGQTIWRTDLDATLFDVPANAEIPHAMRWFPSPDSGRSRQAGNVFHLGGFLVREPPRCELTGPYVAIPDAPQLVTLADTTRLAVVANRSLVMLDPTSGQQLEMPIDIGGSPGQPAQWADTDGDGTAELVLLEEVAGLQPGGRPDPQLSVWSYARQQPLWTRRLDAYWPGQRAWTIDSPNWPLVVDLEGDGKSEVIVPDGRSHNSGSFLGGNFSRETPTGALVVLSGESGDVRWAKRLVTIDAQVDHFVDGPDIDGDGTRDIFVATLAGEVPNLHIDALSGTTGQVFWGAKHVLRPEPQEFTDFQLAPLAWWRSSVDGWPQLLVNVNNEHAGRKQSAVSGYSAGTGTVTHRGDAIEAVRPVDLDGDQIEDLLVQASSASGATSVPGELYCVRGIGSQPWKRWTMPGRPIADLDADGIEDFVQSWGDGTLRATSGGTGRELWRTRAIRATSELGIRSAGDAGSLVSYSPSMASRADSQLGDLNGDGHADLLVYETHTSNRTVAPLHAISGKTGRLLWSIQDVRVREIDGTIALQTADLDRDGVLEVIWLAAIDRPTSSSSPAGMQNNIQLWAFVVSASNGRVKWSRPLSPTYTGLPGGMRPMKFDIVSTEVATSDLDGDGIQDLVLPALADDNALEVRALDGAQGELLWTRTRQADGLGNQSLENWTAATVCDLEGDGEREIVLVEPHVRPSSGGIPPVDVAVSILSGKDGRQRWSETTDCDFTHFSTYSDAKGALLRPVVLRVAGGRQRVAVVLPGDQPRIVTFDASGYTAQRKLGFTSRLGNLFVCDGDGDQVDELYFVEQATLCAVSVDRPEVRLWQRRLGDLGIPRILDVLPGTDAAAPLIVVATDPTDNTVLGVAADTGEIAWTCPGPIARDRPGGAFMVPSSIAQLGARAGEAPLLHWQFDAVAVCRQAVWRSPPGADAEAPDARRLASHWLPRGVHVTPARLAGIENDRRWKRDLPWWPTFVEARSDLLRLIGWGCFFSLTLFLVPGGYGYWLVKQRRISLACLLGLPMVAAVVIQALLIPAGIDSRFVGPSGRFFLGLVSTPPLCSGALLIVWLGRRQWRRLLLWLSLAFALGAIATWLGITADLRMRPLVEHESYDWSGWYAIFLPVSYSLSWIMLPAALCERGIYRFRQLRQRRAQSSASGMMKPAS